MAPYRKNDNCCVEQKNWPIVRQQVGYARYDTPAELQTLRELYAVLRLYVNFFQRKMKLVSKTRHGAKAMKRFDAARTPYQRTLESSHVTDAAKDALRRTYLELNPAQLKRDLATLQAKLLQLAADSSILRKEVRRHGPPVPGALSIPHALRTSSVMQPRNASRTS